MWQEPFFNSRSSGWLGLSLTETEAYLSEFTHVRSGCMLMKEVGVVAPVGFQLVMQGDLAADESRFRSSCQLLVYMHAAREVTSCCKSVWMYDSGGYEDLN